MNPFDGYMKKAFDVTLNVMGSDASWTPSAGGETLTARVHFREPNGEDTLNGATYAPFTFVMEYRIDFFPGLIDRVRSGYAERVVINGTTYHVHSVVKIQDGQTFQAALEQL